MRQDGICVTGLNKLERCPPVMPGNRLVSKPDDRPIGIARQLLSRCEDPHHGLQALLDKRRFGPLGKGVAV